jgi:TRAP-type C4-dicarboxylate transport system substrate-binding protein
MKRNVYNCDPHEIESAGDAASRRLVQPRTRVGMLRQIEDITSMFAIVRLFAILLALAAYPATLAAAPVTLKMSYYTSDRSTVYQCFVSPFVEAVNKAGAGVVVINVVFSGGAAIPEQPKLVRDGTVDLAVVVPGYSPQEFPDTSVLQLPGVYRDNREASLVYAKLGEAGALRDYQPFVFVGGYVSPGEDIHSRKPLAKLDDLKAQSIRVNNLAEAEALRMLGASPVLLPINRTMENLNAGTLDGVTVPDYMVFEFGFGRLTAHHYLAGLGGAALAIVMNQAKFDSLPAGAQKIVKQYGGEWLAAKTSACVAAKGEEVLARLKADARRKVTEPTPADLATLHGVYASVVEAWAAESAHNRELLGRANAELAKLRKEPPK